MKGFSPNRSDFRARALASKRSANMKEMLFFVLFYEILCTFMAKFFEQGREVHHRSILVSSNKPKPSHAWRSFLAILFIDALRHGSGVCAHILQDKAPGDT